ENGKGVKSAWHKGFPKVIDPTRTRPK
ncbi:hypothetical protein I7I51_04979, partial [Histoplasma capsulatum]